MKKVLLLAIAVIFFVSCKKTSSIPVVINSINPMTDGPGAPLTITGTGFGTDSLACFVLFNGKPAIFTYFSDTLLKVKVPSNAITGKIQVLVKEQSAFSKDDFVILSGKWTRKENFPADGRANLIAFTISNKAYVGLGNSNGPDYNDLYEFDPITNKWTQKANLPNPGITRATAVTAGGKGYVICGAESVSGNIAGKKLFEYDPGNNTWTRKTDIPGVGHIFGGGFSINGKIYYGTGGGDSIGSILKDWWEYDPAIDTWKQKKDVPFGPVSNAVGFAIGTKGYLGASFFSNPQRTFWEYEATTDTWTRMADFPGVSNYYPFSFVMNGKGYVAAGTINTCFEYDPSSNTWTQRTSHPFQRVGGIGFAIGNKGYAVSGSASKYLDNDFWEFSLQ